MKKNNDPLTTRSLFALINERSPVCDTSSLDDEARPGDDAQIQDR